MFREQLILGNLSLQLCNNRRKAKTIPAEGWNCELAPLGLGRVFARAFPSVCATPQLTVWFGGANFGLSIVYSCMYLVRSCIRLCVCHNFCPQETFRPQEIVSPHDFFYPQVFSGPNGGCGKKVGSRENVEDGKKGVAKKKCGDGKKLWDGKKCGDRKKGSGQKKVGDKKSVVMEKVWASLFQPLYSFV